MVFLFHAIIGLFIYMILPKPVNDGNAYWVYLYLLSFVTPDTVQELPLAWAISALLILPTVFIVVRWSLAPAAAAAGETRPLIWSWHMTRGLTLKLVLTLYVLVFPVIVAATFFARTGIAGTMAFLLISSWVVPSLLTGVTGYFYTQLKDGDLNDKADATTS